MYTNLSTTFKQRKEYQQIEKTTYNLKLPKKGGITLCSNWRGINFTPTTNKFWGR
jgi:hypothetical protein